MARVCEISGRKTSTGHSKKHRRGRSGGSGVWRFKAPKTKRTWRPNLRRIRIVDENGTPRRIKVSMKAYKRLRKLEKEQQIKTAA